MTDRPRKSKAAVVKLMEATFGQQKSELLIETASRAVGLTECDGYTYEDVESMLQELGRAPGLIGIGARFAKSRLSIAWEDNE